MLLLIFIYSCYVFFPLEQSLLLSIDIPFKRSHLELILSGVFFIGILHALVQQANRGGIRISPLREQLAPIFPLVLFLAFKGIISLGSATSLTMFARDAKMLIFFVVVAGLLLIGRQQRLLSHLRMGGAILAGLLIVQFLWLALNGTITRPYGSGEINYDAALLLIAYLACKHLELDPVERALWLKILIVGGLLATFSRTALASLILIEGMSAVRSRRGIVSFVLLLIPALFTIYTSFMMRNLEISLDGMDRFWMWVSVIEMAQSANWTQLLFGWPWGVPINSAIPPALDYLFNSQADTSGVPGVYAYNFHAFWLRLFLNGGLTSLILLGWMFIAHLRQSAYRFPAFVFILVAGLTMGLFYTSNVAIILLVLWIYTDRLPPPPTKPNQLGGLSCAS